MWATQKTRTEVTAMAVTDACRDINELVPYVKQRIEKWLNECKAAGLAVKVSETYRSNERQLYLYNKGASTIKTTGAHGFRIAVDYYIDQPGNIYPADKMKTAAQIAKKIGFEWGGAWTSFKDTPHLQMLGGVSLANFRLGRRPSWYNDMPAAAPEIPTNTVPEKPATAPEEDDMTQEAFNIMFDNAYNAMQKKRASEAPSDWAAEIWDNASKMPALDGSGKTMFDGSNPRGFISREEMATVLTRGKVIRKQ